MERLPKTHDPRSILFILPTWVGDFVMATPTLRAIRNRFGDARIVFLMEPNLRELVRGGDWMDECVEWPDRSKRSLFHRAYRDLVRRLRRERFDWAILLPNSFRSALLARLTGAKRRVGYDREGRGLLLTDRIPVKNRLNQRGSSWSGNTSRAREQAVSSTQSLSDVRTSTDRNAVDQEANSGAQLDLMHPPAPPGEYLPMPIVEYYADLAEFIGCDRPGDALELFTTPDCEASLAEKLAEKAVGDAAPLIVISPGAKFGASKCWPTDRFAATADRLIESERANVVVTCGPGEEPIARAITSSMKRKPVLFDGSLLSLGELKSLIRRADLLICNDAGPRHFAKAFGVPVVTIFGPTHPDWTATTFEREKIVRIHVDCGPCQQKVCPLGHLNCMTGVSVEMVVSAAQDLLRSHIADSIASVAPR